MSVLVSYTVPCHKRVEDLKSALPSVIAAANEYPPVEIVVVDYGNEVNLYHQINDLVLDLLKNKENIVTVKRVEAEYFHMSHARNVGIKAATGQIIVAFLADQIVSREFFSVVRKDLRTGTFLKWKETFCFHRADILSAGGFDERMEFYGPEGKELTNRLERRGLITKPLRPNMVSLIPTPNHEKVRNYREKISKQEMHRRGMAIWEENRAAGLLVANDGREWGSAA